MGYLWRGESWLLVMYGVGISGCGKCIVWKLISEHSCWWGIFMWGNVVVISVVIKLCCGKIMLWDI